MLCWKPGFCVQHLIVNKWQFHIMSPGLMQYGLLWWMHKHLCFQFSLPMMSNYTPLIMHSLTEPPNNARLSLFDISGSLFLRQPAGGPRIETVEAKPQTTISNNMQSLTQKGLITIIFYCCLSYNLLTVLFFFFPGGAECLISQLNASCGYCQETVFFTQNVFWKNPGLQNVASIHHFLITVSWTMMVHYGTFMDHYKANVMHWTAHLWLE